MSQIKARKRAGAASGTSQQYPKFGKINGEHPLKHTVPASYVGYSARYRPNGEVYYFNFELAREMGLIPKHHDGKLDVALNEAILETFSLQIINEFDVLNNTPIDKDTVKPHQYMATRYLQLQHPNKTGLTSGDGRSIWNGTVKGPNAIWDISSCGTGATRLSPATAIEKKFFKTGDKNVSYGCGLARTSEGLSGAIMSDILHQNGIPTERTLAIIRFPGGTSINIRASKNLLRPAHFFGFMKRGDRESLQNMLDYYVEREIYNGALEPKRLPASSYTDFLNYVCDNFARATALYEGEYIFCWLDWDGDNILTDGGIIDYGTIRQFGLFHHEYRYEDVDKWSTNITQQRNKARSIVQTFAQIVDFVQTGIQKPLGEYKSHDILERFDQCFEKTFLSHLLFRIGYTPEQRQKLLADEQGLTLVRQFRTQVRYYEKAVAPGKPYKVADGIMRDAIFCMRDMLRELPKYLIKKGVRFPAEKFVDVMSSTYASDRLLAKFRKDTNRINRFQNTYLKLADRCADIVGMNKESVIFQLFERSALINRYEKITGDALIHISERLTRTSLPLNFQQRTLLIEQFISDQVLDPDRRADDRVLQAPKGKNMQQIFRWLFRTIKQNRSGI
ncbi:MAG: protein adenylyltransferase SelO family protein [Gammaproteobacteria bacterium]|nr:protein adenylyltransferase SelO family protein [Gammaproteobacteria bacterium]